MTEWGRSHGAALEYFSGLSCRLSRASALDQVCSCKCVSSKACCCKCARANLLTQMRSCAGKCAKRGVCGRNRAMFPGRSLRNDFGENQKTNYTSIDPKLHFTPKQHLHKNPQTACPPSSCRRSRKNTPGSHQAPQNSTCTSAPSCMPLSVPPVTPAPQNSTRTAPQAACPLAPCHQCPPNSTPKAPGRTVASTSTEHPKPNPKTVPAPAPQTACPLTPSRQSRKSLSPLYSKLEPL